MLPPKLKGVIEVLTFDSEAFIFPTNRMVDECAFGHNYVDFLVRRPLPLATDNVIGGNYRLIKETSQELAPNGLVKVIGHLRPAAFPRWSRLFMR